MSVLLGDVRGHHRRAPVGLLAPPFLVRDFSFCHCARRVSQVWGWPSPPSPARGQAGLAEKQNLGRGMYRHSQGEKQCPTQWGTLPAPHTPQTRIGERLVGCVLRSVEIVSPHWATPRGVAPPMSSPWGGASRSQDHQ